MPSPTSSTRPTSVRVTSASNCSISRWMTDVISLALKRDMGSPEGRRFSACQGGSAGVSGDDHGRIIPDLRGLLLDEPAPDLFQAVADGGIIHAVADLDHQAADQRRVDLQPEDRRAVDQLRQA